MIIATASSSLAATATPPSSLVRVLTTAEENGGFGSEIPRVVITGKAVDEQGNAVAGARVFAVATPSRRPGGYVRTPIETKSDNQGNFRFDALEVLVTDDRSGPSAQPSGGEFCVYGMAEGFGFTWAREFEFRPAAAPASRNAFDLALEGTPDQQLFYLARSSPVELVFAPAAMFAGFIADDLGRPNSGAKVQNGYVHNTHLGRKYGTSRCRYTPPSEHATNAIGFAAIQFLPAEVRETTTNQQGEFRLTQLRGHTSYAALICPANEYDAKSLTVYTESAPQGGIRATDFYTGVSARGDQASYVGQFVRPRKTSIRVLTDTDSTPVAGATLIADNDAVRLFGNRAMTDADGVAQLQLTPGEYQLRLEPPHDAPLLYREAALVVGDAAESHQDFSLQPAATVVITAVDEESGEPVAGVRFKYQTGQMPEPQLLSSQTAVCDYCVTDADGECRAFLPAAPTTFIVAQTPQGLTPEKGKSEELQLAAQESYEQVFRFDSTSAKLPEAGEQNLPEGLARKIQEQQKLVRNASLVITANSFVGSRLGELTPGAFRTALDGLPAGDVPDIRGLFEELTDTPLRMSQKVVTVDGRRRKEARIHQGVDGTEQRDYFLFNGQEGILYRQGSGQIDVYPQHNFPIHVAGLSDFVSSINPQPQFASDLIAGEVVLTATSQKSRYEAFLNEQTGFLRRLYFSSDDGNGRATWQFGQASLDNGLLLPRLHIQANFRKGQIASMYIHEIVKVELKTNFLPDAFAAPAPPGTTLVDYVNQPEDQDRPNAFRLNAPVTDAAAYVKRRASM